MNPKVSIIVPVYKVEEYIERCVQSLFEQTFQDIEYIFVNDATPDNSIGKLLDVINRYEYIVDRITIINHDVNKGLSSARKTGILSASGDYCIHIDSDDRVETDMIEVLYNAAIREEADIVGCDYYDEYVGKLKYNKQCLSTENIVCIKQMLSRTISHCVWNKLIKRSLYFDNNVYPIDNVGNGEDLALIPRLFFYAKKIAYVPRAFYYYSHLNVYSYSNQVNYKSYEDLLFVIRYIEMFFENQKCSFRLYDSFLELKYFVKLQLLIDNNFACWTSLYPEVDRCIWLCKDISFKYRVLGFLASHHMCFLGKMFFKIGGCIKRMLQ